MERYFYDLVGAVQGVVLFVLLITLLRGPARKFPTLLTYVAFEFLATSALTVASLVWVDASNPSAAGNLRYDRIYWTADFILDLLRFFVVISLTHEATPQGPTRKTISRLLVGIVVVATVLPFVLFHPVFNFAPWPDGRWSNSASQLLNFAAAIMNLALWGTIISSRKRDPELLRVSAGLGIIVAGEALSYGFRHFAHTGGALVFFANALLQLTQVAGWSIWIWTFWPAPKPHTAAETVPLR